MLLENGVFTPARISAREELVLVAFSILYSVNIVVSNVSLQLVTVPVSAFVNRNLIATHDAITLLSFTK